MLDRYLDIVPGISSLGQSSNIARDKPSAQYHDAKLLYSCHDCSLVEEVERTSDGICSVFSSMSRGT